MPILIDNEEVVLKPTNHENLIIIYLINIVILGVIGGLGSYFLMTNIARPEFFMTNLILAIILGVICSFAIVIDIVNLIVRLVDKQKLLAKKKLEYITADTIFIDAEGITFQNWKTNDKKLLPWKNIEWLSFSRRISIWKNVAVIVTDQKNIKIDLGCYSNAYERPPRKAKKAIEKEFRKYRYHDL